MTTKEQKNAADKVARLQADLIKARADLDENRAAMVEDPTNDAIAKAIMTGQIKIDAINTALDQALDNQRRAEVETNQAEAKAQLKRLDDLEAKAQRDQRAIYNAIEALKKDLDQLQKEAGEHNRLTNKYSGKGGYINKSDYRLLWRLSSDLEKLQKQKRFIDNLGRPQEPDKPRPFTQLQKDVHAMRYRDPNAREVTVTLLEPDDGTGEPVYRVSK